MYFEPWKMVLIIVSIAILVLPLVSAIVSTAIKVYFREKRKLITDILGAISDVVEKYKKER